MAVKVMMIYKGPMRVVKVGLKSGFLKVTRGVPFPAPIGDRDALLSTGQYADYEEKAPEKKPAKSEKDEKREKKSGKGGRK